VARHVAQGGEQPVRRALVVGVGQLDADAPVVGEVEVHPVVLAQPVGDPVAGRSQAGDVHDDLQRVQIGGAAGTAEVVPAVDVHAQKALSALEDRRVDHAALPMEDGALFEAGAQLVDRGDAHVGPGVHGPGREVRMERQMGTPCLVDDERHAVVVAAAAMPATSEQVP
jgi:hypothetical protein